MNEQVYNTLSVNGSGVPGEIRIFLNHIYEFKKGIRNMVLYTINKKYEGFAISRLEKQNICFLKQEVNAHKINTFFQFFHPIINTLVSLVIFIFFI